jgi:hypothetical protein
MNKYLVIDEKIIMFGPGGVIEVDSDSQGLLTLKTENGRTISVSNRATIQKYGKLIQDALQPIKVSE